MKVPLLADSSEDIVVDDLEGSSSGLFDNGGALLGSSVKLLAVAALSACFLFRKNSVTFLLLIVGFALALAKHIRTELRSGIQKLSTCRREQLKIKSLRMHSVTRS